jgi:MFS family permease
MRAVAHDAATGIWTGNRRALTVGLVMTVTLVAFESLAVSTVMPDVEADLGDLYLYGWVFSGFFLGQLLGIVTAGQSADRHGLARPFVIALALFAGGLLAAGLAPSMAVLVAARVVQGLGGGAIPALAYVAAGRGYAPEVRPHLFAIMSTAWVVPGLVGPAIAGALSDHIDWRVVFLGLLPLVIVAGAIAFPALARLGPGDHAHGRDRRGDALLVTIGAALVIGALGSGRPIVAIPIGVIGAVVGVRAFLRLVPPGTVRLAPGLPAAIATRGILTFAFFGADAYVTLALTSVRDTSTTVAGIALSLASVTWATASWVQSRRVHVDGPRRLVTVGFCVVAAGISGLILVLAPSVPLAIAVGVWGVAGFGMGLAYAPLSVTMLDLAEPGREGDASASLQLCDVLGIALGTGASGAVIALGESLGWSERTPLAIAFTAMTVVALGGAVAAHRLPRMLRG